MGTNLKTGSAVFVEWEDSYGSSSRWQDISVTGDPPRMVCRTLGWVIKCNQRFLVVVPHLAANEELGVEQGCGDMAIPRAAIIKCRRLKALDQAIGSN